MTFESDHFNAIEKEIAQIKRSVSSNDRRISSLVAGLAGGAAAYLIQDGHTIWAIAAFFLIIWMDYSGR